MYALPEYQNHNIRERLWKVATWSQMKIKLIPGLYDENWRSYWEKKRKNVGLGCIFAHIVGIFFHKIKVVKGEVMDNHENKGLYGENGKAHYLIIIYQLLYPCVSTIRCQIVMHLSYFPALSSLISRFDLVYVTVIFFSDSVFCIVLTRCHWTCFFFFQLLVTDYPSALSLWLDWSLVSTDCVFVMIWIVFIITVCWNC